MKRLACLMLFVLCACASPQVQRHAETARAEPALSEDFLTASDGTQLSYRRWLPPDETHAVVIALHGFNDYSHGFQIPGEFMRLQHIAVYAYDQRGFGATAERGIWAGEQNLVSDASDMVKAVRQRYPATPIYLMGESMGAAVAIVAANRHDFPRIEGVILVAPAVWGGDTMNPFYRASLWAFSHIVPDKKMSGEDLHILATDNFDMLRAFGADPLVIKETRVDAIWGLVELMDDAYIGIATLKQPVFMLYGKYDQVIPKRPVINAMKKAPKATTVAYYPLGFHMLLRDLHGSVPGTDIVAWIGAHDKPLPSGNDAAAQKFLK